MRSSADFSSKESSDVTEGEMVNGSMSGEGELRVDEATEYESSIVKVLNIQVRMIWIVVN